MNTFETKDKRGFETVNETTLKIYGFILEFHNTNFYVILFVIYVIK
jgi:hypothetical protein